MIFLYILENKLNSSNFNEAAFSRQTSHLPKSSIFARKTRKTLELKDISLQTQAQNKAYRLKQRIHSFFSYALIATFSHFMQVSYNSCKDVDRDDEEFRIGDSNMFLEDHKKLIKTILEDKEEDNLEVNEQSKSAQERNPNIKRKNTKYHSNIVDNLHKIEPPLRKQKSGSLAIHCNQIEIPVGINCFTLYYIFLCFILR